MSKKDKETVCVGSIMNKIDSMQDAVHDLQKKLNDVIIYLEDVLPPEVCQDEIDADAAVKTAAEEFCLTQIFANSKSKGES